MAKNNTSDKEEKLNSQFNLDIPISTPDEDELDRNGFSERLAESIINWEGDRSLVVGLHGNWGSGKTSIKNLIRYYLEQKGINAGQMLDFNPWYWSNQEKLYGAFFKEVGLLFRKKKKDKNYKEIAKKWQILANKLGFAQIIFSGTLKYQSCLFLFWDLLELIFQQYNYQLFIQIA